VRALVLAALLLIAPAASSVPAQDAALTLAFASPEEAAAILGASDPFTRAMNLLDRRIRVQSRAAVTEMVVLEFLRTQAVAWSADERRRLQPMFDDVSARTRTVAPMLAGRVPVVRSTSAVESGLPHTRGGAIVLPERTLGWTDPEIRRVLAHELFHILTRRDPALRDRLYAAIGFRPCAAVDVPADMTAMKLTNPDAPEERFAVLVRYLGVELEVVPRVLSTAKDLAAALATPLDGQVEVWFVAIARDGDRCRAVIGPDGPVRLLPRDLENFFEQVGRNTRYVIHPEEILADNFARLVLGERSVPSPDVLDRLRKALAEPPRR
jgi:hypothetical protein